jgi:UDP-N-acetylmuramoyl-L-alanyl-D-glutamate--2,6-diaminopimelate ligase
MSAWKSLSSALELNRVSNVAYDIVALNNISREHIDLHGSFENYLKSKTKLIRDAGPQQWAILNLDCPYAASLVDQTKAQVLTYGIKNTEGTLHCKNVDLSTGRAKFTVEIKKELSGRRINIFTTGIRYCTLYSRLSFCL